MRFEGTHCLPWSSVSDWVILSQKCGRHGTLREEVQPDGEAASFNVRFVTIEAECAVRLPQWRCSSCGPVALCPASFGCYAATPTRPSVFFDEMLLQLGQLLRLQAPYASKAAAKAFGSLHERNGSDCKPTTWREFGAGHFGSLDAWLQRGEGLGIKEIATGVLSEGTSRTKAAIAAALHRRSSLKYVAHESYVPH